VDKTTAKAIKLALKNFRKDLEAPNNENRSKSLDHAYTEAMERIEGQVAGFQGLAKQVLSWITCAKRPLTTLELRHALAVENGELELDKENFLEVEDMVSVCAGLVTIDKESDIIRLVHYTTQEYFERTWEFWFPNAQRDIAMTCITYLSFDTFGPGFCPTDDDLEARLQSNPLYDYAAQNWGHHARTAPAEVEPLILDLLENETKVSGCSQALMASKRYSSELGYRREVPRQMTGVHLAAYFGLKETIMALLKNGCNPNSKDTYGRTPLLWAAMNGHESVVHMLLARTGFNLGDKYSGMPLSWDTEKGREVVVKLLLGKDGVSSDFKDNDNQTALWWAARNGHEAIVKLLLMNNGIAPNSAGRNGWTALSWAMKRHKRQPSASKFVPTLEFSTLKWPVE
jgi:hypothetical protein